MDQMEPDKLLDQWFPKNPGPHLLIFTLVNQQKLPSDEEREFSLSSQSISKLTSFTHSEQEFLTKIFCEDESAQAQRGRKRTLPTSDFFDEEIETLQQEERNFVHVRPAIWMKCISVRGWNRAKRYFQALLKESPAVSHRSVKEWANKHPAQLAHGSRQAGKVDYSSSLPQKCSKEPLNADQSPKGLSAFSYLSKSLFENNLF
ncbi:hypothetical protein GOBAR_DD09633 [Gossypium barbadense]|nr:hypothetical protein GOBAR_DD09633 [Gossypium barbadense]